MESREYILAQGSHLDHYSIVGLLGEGGFGLTYLAIDSKLDMKVVIKEYFPSEIAIRADRREVHPKEKRREAYLKGLLHFKEEARILARFKHPSIVRILNYFEANNTAYFVMEYEEGVDLARYLKQHSVPLSQEEILSIMMPILEGLKEVHSYNFLHRDIKPGNILLRKNHSPVLIDFGASKEAVAEVSKSVTNMLTEGYAPIEQYGSDIRQQGPWTDLYAIGAVIYKMLTGEAPPSAIERQTAILNMEDDPLKSLESFSSKGYDRGFLKAVERALSIARRDRPQSVQEFQEDIAGRVEMDEGKSEGDRPEARKRFFHSPMCGCFLFFS